MSKRHLLGLIGITLAVSVAFPASASARQSIAAASPTAMTCDVAPRSLSEIMTLADSAPDDAAPVLPLPAGVRAGAETTAAIETVLAEMGACLTAGEMLRFYALHSDAWLRRFAGSIEGLTTLTTSTPPLADGDRAVYLGPWHVQFLPDGRVLAAVLLRVGNEIRPDPQRTRVLLFVQRDERWLVDETIEQVRLAECDVPVDVAAVVGPPPGALFDSWSASCE
ncbi:MAG: hypothetical protein H0T18_09140 [Chloroflexia bacterium]|nr:hypothetical protein [Chloroflexia bacterium]